MIGQLRFQVQTMTRIFYILIALMVSGCASNDTPTERSDKVKHKIAQMKLARDPHTYSKPSTARVTHLDWDAEINFDTRIISAKARYTIEQTDSASEIVLDTKGLNIISVMNGDKPLSFQVGIDKEFIGAPLSIAIDSNVKSIEIKYETSPKAEALLWVEGEEPFLFTQSQAILARTWLPCQDSPGVRFTYNARVKVAPQFLALMSATNPQAKNHEGIYTFEMRQPIPAYLMALAVGNISFKSTGPRTGVYAIPSVIDAAVWEFAELESMVETAEKLYGQYAWERYDILVLPAAFPFGGMENPRLTFVSPTVIAGDRSLVSLIAHELAHSWSGNLVTNSTWNDFWLNEGFTVYFEQRVMEALQGRDVSEMLAQLNRQDLDATIADLNSSGMNADTKLKLNLNDRNPDDGMTDIAYNKGYFFLRMLEEAKGREEFDKFLKAYFEKNKFQNMDTENFASLLQSNLIDSAQYQQLQINEWIFGEGIPSNIPQVLSHRLDKVDDIRIQFEKKTISIEQIPWSGWSYQERYRFIHSLERFNIQDMTALDKAFNITEIGNNEILFAWLEKAIQKKYKTAYPRLEQFLSSVGRRKFVLPLYQALVENNQRSLAEATFKKYQKNYHAVTIASVQELLTGG
jgi:aminopeptidase N